MKKDYFEAAEILQDAIIRLAASPDNLFNFTSYLAHHFPEWLDKYASTPEDLATEFKLFAEIDLNHV